MKFEELGLKRLSHNIIYTFARQLATLIIEILSAILIARALGPYGNGIYSVAVLIPLLLANFLSFGIGPANVYYIGRGDVNLKDAFKASILLWLLLSGPGFVSIFLIISLKGETLFPQISYSILLIAVIIFPLKLFQLFLLSLFQGVQDFKRFNIISLLVPSIILIGFILLVLIFKLDVIGALLAFGFGQIIGIKLSMLSLKKYLGKESQGSIALKEYIKKCVTYGWKAHLSNILTFVNYRVDIYLINLLINPSATGIYVVAVHIAERLWMLSQAVSIVLFPRLSELHTSEEIRRELTPVVARWVFYITLTLALILILFGKFFINLLFGEEYIHAYSALILLLPGVVLSALSRILSNDISARGKPELNMYVAFLIVIFNIIFNLVLIPLMGIKGAALATSIAYSLNSVVKMYIYSKLSANPWRKVIILNSQDIIILRRAFGLVRNFIITSR